MSANIPETMLFSELLKNDGYICPKELVGMTVKDIITASGAAKEETTLEITKFENKTYTPDEGKVYSSVTVNITGETLKITSDERKDYDAPAGKCYTKVSVDIPVTET